ncbi:MAG: ShlB/FhaC/HecB family hemolysin secretion/activation protein [Leptolyngbyaceae cyanobacterium SL_5_9]|nr:ShlB/FhaC/HecB family hemolysin secretion/activation protein [Leptolyngbyaceae cyanobacterium SL_5_9]
MAIAIPRTVLPIFYTPCIALLVFVLQLPLLAQEKSREDVEPAIDWLEDDPSNGSTLGTARDLEVNFAVEPVEESLQQNFSQQTDSTPTLSSDSTNDECSIPPSAFTAETPSPSISADSTIRAIRVEGSTVLPCEIQAILEQYLGRNLTAEQLSSLQDAITLVYIEAGYLTSRAGTPQAESDGTVLVPVIEGSAVVTVNRIENEEGQDDIDVACPSSTVTSRNRANTRREADFEAYIRRQLQSAEEVPLNTSRLEEELRFLSNDNTRFEKVESVLGSRSDGVSELVICYEEANPLSVSINFSNNAPPSVGSERVDVALSLGNVLEIGDQFFISNQFDPSNFSATRGINAFGLGYRLPLDRRSSTLQFRVEANRNSILQEEFRPLELRAASELYEVSFRYPLQRSYREELGLSVGFAYQDGQTFVFNNIPQPFGIGPDENGVSRTSVISLGIDYLNRDSTGRWLSQAQCRFGLGIFDATSNPGSIPDGQFVSCLGLVQRVQRIGSRNF